MLSFSSTRLMKGLRPSPARPRSKGNGAPSVYRQTDRRDNAVTAQLKGLSERMDQMQGELDHIRRAWEIMGAFRQGVREQIEKNGADLGVQFQRIAMMQAEIDLLKANETVLQTEIAQLRRKNRQ